MTAHIEPLTPLIGGVTQSEGVQRSEVVRAPRAPAQRHEVLEAVL